MTVWYGPYVILVWSLCQYDPYFTLILPILQFGLALTLVLNDPYFSVYGPYSVYVKKKAAYK